MADLRSLLSQLRRRSEVDATHDVPPQQDLLHTLATTLESRERWRSLLYRSVDLVFETDAQGRIVLVSPETWRGSPTLALIGRPFQALFTIDPLQLHDGSMVKVHDPDGRQAAGIVCSTPLKDGTGAVTGARGTVKLLPADIRTTDVTLPAVQETRASEFDADAVINTIVYAVRRSIVPRLAAGNAMDALLPSIHADGALLDTALLPPDTVVTSSTDVPDAILHLRHEPSTAPETHTARVGQHDVLICRERIRSGEELCLVLWRNGSWLPAEQALCRTVCALLAGFWELDKLHRRILSNATFDIASNLLNWTGLKREIERRSRRLDQDVLPATLIVAKIPGLTKIGSVRGFVAGEQALTEATTLLRNAVRPTDAIGRIRSDIFALWLDGGDRFAAAERAERMTAHGIPILIDPPIHLPLQLGLVSREANSPETPDMLLERGMQALQEGEEENRKWRFSHETP